MAKAAMKLAVKVPRKTVGGPIRVLRILRPAAVAAYGESGLFLLRPARKKGFLKGQERKAGRAGSARRRKRARKRAAGRRWGRGRSSGWTRPRERPATGSRPAPPASEARNARGAGSHRVDRAPAPTAGTPR